MADRKKKERRTLSASDVVDALRKSALFNSENDRSPCAMLEEVSNGTGSRATRRADALVVSLWPSRGIWFAGIEVKVSRTDWTNELKNPAKAGAFFKWCNHWWLATAEGVALEEEIPATWGWVEVVATEAKVSCVVRKQAPKLEPEPLSPDFVAAVLRKVAVGEDVRQRAALNKAREQAWAIEKIVDDVELDRLRRVEKAHNKLARQIEEFCAASGESLNDFQFNAGDIGRARALAGEIVRRHKQTHRPWNIPQELRTLADQIEGAEKELERLKDAGHSALKNTVAALTPTTAEVANA